MSIDRAAVIAAYPLDRYLERIGKQVVKAGAHHKACCPFHADKTPSMLVNLDKEDWWCFACGFGGTVIDMEMRLKGLPFKDAIQKLADDAGIRPDETQRRVATYDYRDEHGRPVMKVDRIEAGEKKRFTQYREKDGQRVNGIEGVQRVLYRLDRWAGKSEVMICEGEKCVEALERLGWDATCNPGGSNAWLVSYASYLTEKHITLWPDNDEPGAKWMDAVIKSVEGKCASLRVMKVPEEYGDIADLIDGKGADLAARWIIDAMERTPAISRGVHLPILSSAECYALYKSRVNSMEEHAVDLGKWLPTLRHNARALLPGDLALFLSDTGVGKTAALTNIAFSQRPLPTIFFELELAAEAMCERFIARDTGCQTLDVEKKTRAGEAFNVAGWDHVFICPESRVTIERMEEIIERAELKIGERPRLILVDYVGLMGGGSGKRYERMSTIAEGLKVLARVTETVVIMASQVKRDDERLEVRLHDAKDSGSVENSAQLVLGAWRPSQDEMTIKVLKQTKRAGQFEINCIFDGHRQLIREIAKPESGGF